MLITKKNLVITLFASSALFNTNPLEATLGQKQSNDTESYPHCYVKKSSPPRSIADNNPRRARMIQSTEKKWLPGTTLSYYFFDKDTDGINIDDGQNKTWHSYKGSEKQKNAIRQAFQTWKDVGLNINFVETNNRKDATIRIAFAEFDGSWSYVGRDILGETDKNQPTMNIGWVAKDTPLHEIGHSLGLEHEHQNPFSGIEWDIKYLSHLYAGYPNYWDQKTIEENITDKVGPNAIRGTKWDPNSIMHYAFEPNTISQPEKYKTGLNPEPGLSEKDKECIRALYPFTNHKAIISIGNHIINLDNGGATEITIEVPKSGYYTIETIGDLDTFIDIADPSGQPIDEDDDGGEDRNACMNNLKLKAGTKYTLRVRLYYKHEAGQFTLSVRQQDSKEHNFNWLFWQ
jgi:hypothetical protein